VLAKAREVLLPLFAAPRFLLLVSRRGFGVTVAASVLYSICTRCGGGGIPCSVFWKIFLWCIQEGRAFRKEVFHVSRPSRVLDAFLAADLSFWIVTVRDEPRCLRGDKVEGLRQYASG